MERSPEYREMDRIVTRLVEGGLINVDPYTESVRVESAGVQQLAAPVEEANRDIVALQSQLAAEREAVRVWKEKHKVLVEEVDAWREWNDREPHNPDAGIMRIEDARAATDAAKAREHVRLLLAYPQASTPQARASVQGAGAWQDELHPR